MTPADPFAETDEWPTPDRWTLHAETGLTPLSRPTHSPNDDRVVWRDRGVRIAALEAENAELLLLLADETYREEGGLIVVGQLVDARNRAEAAEAALLRVRALREGIEALHEMQVEMGVQPWCEADGKPWPCPTIALLVSPPAATTGEAGPTVPKVAFDLVAAEANRLWDQVERGMAVAVGGAGTGECVPCCRDCGKPWAPVRRGECAYCGCDAGPAPVSSGEAGTGEDMCPNCLTPWKCNGPHTEGGAR
jgi:hypothetical protein